jgi:hypothetical protein
LRIGFGEVDYFSGKIREVRLYGRALVAADITRLVQQSVQDAALDAGP